MVTPSLQEETVWSATGFEFAWRPSAIVTLGILCRDRSSLLWEKRRNL